MPAPDLPEIPTPLKNIQHYLKIATEHDQRDPVVSYWARLYSLQAGLKLSTKTPAENNFLLKLMDWLEMTKKSLIDNEAITNEVAAQAHLENWALKLFLYADKNDREGTYNKSVVQSFYTAGLLYDVLTTFGELTEEAVQNRKYAKWKAAYIHNCLKTGETPVPGPMKEDGEDNDDSNLDVGPGPDEDWSADIGIDDPAPNDREEENQAVPDVPEGEASIPEKADGENPSEPEIDEADEEKPSEPEIDSADEQKPSEPREDPADEENPLEPEIDPADGENPSELELDPADEEKPSEPGEDPADEENPLEPEIDPADGENPSELELDPAYEEKPSEPGEDPADEENPLEPETDPADEENPSEPEPEKVPADEEKPSELGEDRADEEKPSEPETVPADEENTSEPGVDPADEENPSEPGIDPADEENPSGDAEAPQQPTTPSSTDAYGFPSVPDSATPKSMGSPYPNIPTPAAPNPYNPTPTPTTPTIPTDYSATPAAGGSALNVEQSNKALKYIKWASSALTYDDIPTTIENLQKALHLLTTGQDS